MSDHPRPDPEDQPVPRPTWERLPPGAPRPDWTPPPPPAFGQDDPAARPASDEPSHWAPPGSPPPGSPPPGSAGAAPWAPPDPGSPPASWAPPDPGARPVSSWAQPDPQNPGPAPSAQTGQAGGWSQADLGAQPAPWAQTGQGGGWGQGGDLAWGAPVGPPPPPEGPGRRPVLLRTPVVLGLVLLILLSLGGLGWWLASSFQREVGDLGDLEEFLDEETASDPGSAPRGTVGGAPSDGNFTLSDIEIREDSFDAFEIRGTVTYEGDEPVLANLSATISRDGDDLGEATTDAAVPFLPGDTRRLAFLTTDDYAEGADDVDLVVDEVTETDVEVVDGTQTVDDLTFSDIRVAEDAVGDFQVDATVTWSGDEVLEDAALLATVRDGDDTVAELSASQTLDPGEPLSLSFLSFDSYGDFDAVEFDADLGRSVATLGPG